MANIVDPDQTAHAQSGLDLRFSHARFFSTAQGRGFICCFLLSVNVAFVRFRY